MSSARSCLIIAALFASSMSGLGQPISDFATLSARVIELYHAGKHAEATEIAERCLALAESRFDADDINVAGSLSNLGKLYQVQGRATEAEPLLKRALAIYEKARGSDHPSVAAALDDLAAVYQAQGRTTEAERLSMHSRALRESASALKEADGVEKRALELCKTGNPADATPLMWKAVEVREQATPPDNDAIAEGLSHLVILHLAQGKLTEAEAMFKRELALREEAPIKQIGKITRDLRPQLAECLYNLAALYETERRLDAAEPLYRRAIAIYEEVAIKVFLPYLAESLTKLAAIYQAKGRFADAEPLFKRAFTIYENELSPDHSQLGVTLNELAALYKSQGRLGEAEALEERSFQMRR
jgi:tetratricopeptide (TPR) repeat protein